MKLILVYDVWLNPEQITWLEPSDRGGTYINFAGGDPGFAEIDGRRPDEVASMINRMIYVNPT